MTCRGLMGSSTCIASASLWAHLGQDMSGLKPAVLWGSNQHDFQDLPGTKSLAVHDLLVIGVPHWGWLWHQAPRFSHVEGKSSGCPRATFGCQSYFLWAKEIKWQETRGSCLSRVKVKWQILRFHKISKSKSAHFGSSLHVEWHTAGPTSFPEAFLALDLALSGAFGSRADRSWPCKSVPWRFEMFENLGLFGVPNFSNVEKLEKIRSVVCCFLEWTPLTLALRCRTQRWRGGSLYLNCWIDLGVAEVKGRPKRAWDLNFKSRLNQAGAPNDFHGCPSNFSPSLQCGSSLFCNRFALSWSWAGSLSTSLAGFCGIPQAQFQLRFVAGPPKKKKIYAFNSPHAHSRIHVDVNNTCISAVPVRKVYIYIYLSHLYHLRQDMHTNMLWIILCIKHTMCPGKIMEKW